MVISFALFYSGKTFLGTQELFVFHLQEPGLILMLGTILYPFLFPVCKVVHFSGPRSIGVELEVLLSSTDLSNCAIFVRIAKQTQKHFKMGQAIGTHCAADGE